MQLKHYRDNEWADLPKIESPLFAQSHVERAFTGGRYGVNWIGGMDDLLREGAAQVFTGKDLVTGEPVHRGLEAVGIVPGGKWIFKGAVKCLEKLDFVGKLKGKTVHLFVMWIEPIPFIRYSIFDIRYSIFDIRYSIFDRRLSK